MRNGVLRPSVHGDSVECCLSGPGGAYIQTRDWEPRIGNGREWNRTQDSGGRNPHGSGRSAGPTVKELMGRQGWSMNCLSRLFLTTSNASLGSSPATELQILSTISPVSAQELRLQGNLTVQESGTRNKIKGGQ